MANVYGENYTKEWINDPAEQADKGTSNVTLKGFYEEITGIADTDSVFICKIQHRVRFLELESIVGALGAGALRVIDKDGNATAVAAGDLIDGAIEGGLDLVLTADGTTAATLKVFVRLLQD